MRLKTYTAGSLPEAMAQVRRNLGSDAIILTTKPDGEGGVQVTAALDSDAGDIEPAAAMPETETIAEGLDYHRVPAGLVERLVGAAAGHDAATEVEALAAALAGEIAFARPPRAPDGRPWLLVGPPGAGKTATAAKLAGMARLSGDEAALITLDTAKAGGQVQISVFAEAVEAPLFEANDAGTLRSALDRCPEGALVLIDTLGSSPFNARAQAELAGFVEAAGAAPLAVLAAGGDAMETAEAALAYAEIGARHLVTSKADTVRRLGGVLNAAHSADLALLGAGVAPTIGDGLQPLDPYALARFLLPKSEETRAAPGLVTGADA